MSRRAKGPRLYLRAGRVHSRTGKRIPAVYYIRDGAFEVSTGCGPDRRHEAEQALGAYIAAKHRPIRSEAEDAADRDRPRAPSEVFVAEVLALYAEEKGAAAPDPGSVAARIKALLSWWSDKTLADVRRSSCQAYVAHRQTQPIKSAKADGPNARMVTAQGARRELEDLSAAIGWWAGERPLTVRPKVWLPEKPDSPRDALTRSQAAALLLAALGWRKQPDGRWKRLQGSSRANRAHLRRFVLIGLYTGTRPGVIPRLLWEEAASAPWVDLSTGVVYRRGRDERDHKTKRRPLVRVPNRLRAHLERWRRLDRAEELRRRAASGDQVPPIVSVVHHGGEPLAGRVRRSFDSAVRDAGLPDEITPHWMRHTCATWLMERNVPVWDAAAYTGMTVQTLEKCYGHHRPDHQAAARKALS